MKTLFVGKLPPSTTEESLEALFTPFGRVHSLKLARDIFSGRCKVFGFIEMEGHEARIAIDGLDGKLFGDSEKPLRVRYDNTNRSRGRRRR